MNDPIPDTQVNPATGQVISAPGSGTSALLDKWTVTKPELGDSVSAKLSASNKVSAGQTLTYTASIQNGSDYALNGTQVHIQLPQGTTFAGTTSDTLTVEGDEVVVTLGRIGAGSEQTVEIPVLVSAENRGNERLVASAKVSSSTALPIHSNVVITHVAR